MAVVLASLLPSVSRQLESDIAPMCAVPMPNCSYTTPGSMRCQSSVATPQAWERPSKLNFSVIFLQGWQGDGASRPFVRLVRSAWTCCVDVRWA